MKTIYKYYLDINDDIVIPLPKGAIIISVQMQNDTPCLWAVVDTDAPLEDRKFRMAGTGHPLPNDILDKARPVGTFQMYKGALVFHLFEFCA